MEAVVVLVALIAGGLVIGAVLLAAFLHFLLVEEKRRQREDAVILASGLWIIETDPEHDKSGWVSRRLRHLFLPKRYYRIAIWPRHPDFHEWVNLETGATVEFELEETESEPNPEFGPASHLRLRRLMI